MPTEPTTAIPKGGDDKQHLDDVTAGGELPTIDPDSSAALDQALLEVTEGQTDDAEAQAAADAAAKAKADEEAAKAKADEEAAKAKAAAAPTPTDEEKAKAEAEAKAKADAAAAAAAPVKDRFEEITLPPYTKPKAAEAFATIKTLAREQAAADAKAIADLKAEKAALEEKAKLAGQLPPETAKELEELRAFRAKLDVEADPKFKEWDNKVSANVELIYSKLKTVGVEDAVIEKIKVMGGPSEVEWDVLTDKMPAQAKRYIEGKLFENEDLIEQKKKAVEAIKATASEYIKTKQTGARAAVEAKVNELTPRIDWLQEKPGDDAHNKRAAEIKATMKEAIENDSPEMKGLLIMGIAQLQRVNAALEETKASLAAKEAAWKTEKETLEKNLKDVTDKLEKVKRSGTPRIASSAPGPGDVRTAPKMDPNEDGNSALDRHLAEARAKGGA